MKMQYHVFVHVFFLSDVIFEKYKERKEERLKTDLLHSFINYTFLYIFEAIGTFNINIDGDISSKLEKALHLKCKTRCYSKSKINTKHFFYFIILYF